MTRRNRRPNWRRVKTLRSYTIEEAASLLDVHRNTVRHWIRNGLPAMTDQRPHLIQGRDLGEFLREQQMSRRSKCGPNQFYCFRCREPRTGAEGLVEYQALSPTRGMWLGICPICTSLMRRFASSSPDNSRRFGRA
jgi:excisionase family DNA binding protein